MCEQRERETGSLYYTDVNSAGSIYDTDNYNSSLRVNHGYYTSNCRSD